MRNVSFRVEKMKDACEAGFMDATSLAEYLVGRGIPFRQAHYAAGRLVNLAMRKKVTLSDLEVDDLREVHALLSEEVRAELGAEGVIHGYKSVGSSNPQMVSAEIQRWRQVLKNDGALS